MDLLLDLQIERDLNHAAQDEPPPCRRKFNPIVPGGGADFAPTVLKRLSLKKFPCWYKILLVDF